MSLKLSFCVKAATTLNAQDLDTLTDGIGHYQAAGMAAPQAEAAAVADLIAAVQAEHTELVGHLREQHPDLFKSDRALPAQPPKARGILPVRGSDALGQISSRLGGISSALLPDLSQQVQRKTKAGGTYSVWDNPMQPGAGPLFRAGGTADLSEIARVLEEAGYLTPGSDHPEQQAEALIKAELNKGGSSVRVGDAASIEAEMQRRQDLAQDVPDLPEDLFDHLTDADLAESGYAEAAPEVKALTERLMADAEVAGIDTETARDHAARGIEDQSDDFYHARLQDLLAQALAGPAERAEGNDPGAAARSGERGREAAGGEEPGAGPTTRDAGHAEPGGLTLEAQDAASLQAKTEREAQAHAADRTEQKRLTDKARADAQVGDFTLTGSDRAADQNPDQGVMFSENPDFQDTELLARPEVSDGTPAPQDAAALAKVEAAFRGKVDAFKGLRLTALPRLEKPGNQSSEAERQRYAAADLAEKLFGKRVVFFSANMQFANGLQADYLPGMIFVSEATTRPIQAVLGHELTHSLRTDDPKLYEQLSNRLRGLLEEPGRYGEQLNARRAARGLSPLNFDKLREELIADIVGDNFTDPQFWRQMANGQPSLFGRVLRVVRDFFDNLLAKLRNERPYGTGKYLNDIQAARDAVVEAMSQFAASPKTAANAVTTAAQANLSDTHEPFYSELARQVETAKMTSAPAQGWKDWLKGLVNKGTVKADELAWTGIEDFLNLQTGKVPREQVMDFLNANGVKVTETTLGGDKGAEMNREQIESDIRSRLEGETDAWLRRNYELNDAFEEDPATLSRAQLLDQMTAAEIDYYTQYPDEYTPHSVQRGEVAKYGQYTLPGGTNYREVLLTLPTTKMEGGQISFNPEQQYQSGHWEQSNVLAHIRLNDRTDADGKKVLFVEEIQSDWAQQGKKRGFNDPARAAMLREQADALRSKLDVTTEAGRAAFAERQRLMDEANDAEASGAPPRAPFVGKTDAWVSLAIKRVIKMAADEGYDSVAFVTGEQSADRYDLSKQIDRLTYSEGGILRAYKNGETVINKQVEAKDLPGYVGKDVAQKLVDAPETDQQSSGITYKARELSGLDLKVGGEGMRAFYSKIVPTVAKDVIKKLGGQMGTVNIPLDVKDYERTARYVGPDRTADDVDRLYELSRKGGGDIKRNPITGRDEPFAINRVSVESDLRMLDARMRRGLPFSEAVAHPDISEYAASLFGGRIEHVATPPDISPQIGFEITPGMREKAAGGLPMFSLQYTPDEEAALARAGINTRTRLQRAGDRIRLHYDGALNALRGNWAAQFQQGALDQFTGINRAIRREVGALPTDQDPYVTARLANGGTSSVMRGLMLHGQAKWAANGQHLEKIPGTEGLLDILKPLGTDLNRFFGWMIGNRAARLLKEGREHNFTPAQIATLQGLNQGKEAEFRTAALAYAGFKRSVLDIAEQAGLLDPESRKVWDNADYIPFYREIDDKAVFGATGKKGLSGQSSGIRTLKGGEAALNDPMENILMNFSRLVDASLKNRALAKTVDMLTAAKSDIVQKVGYAMSQQMIPADQVRKQLAEAGTPDQILAIIPPEAFAGMAKMWSIQAPTDPNVVRIMVGGKPHFYQVHDPLLLKALTSFVPFDFPGLGVARAFKRVLTGMVTATPEFMARNFIRDTAATAIITRDGFNPAKSLSGIAKSYREAGAYEDMLFAGASFQTGDINAADPTSTGKAMRRALRKKGFDASSTGAFIGSLIDSPAKFWDKYRHVGEAIENANREAVYEATAKAGKGATAAAYEAKDMMDFTLRGSSPMYQLLADVLPFFNARVQGLYRLGRADPKRVAMYGTLMMLATLALAYANGDNDDYDKLPDWDKESYWHFWIKGVHLRMPKPFELGAIFASVPERILRYARGQDTGKKTLERIWAIARDQLAFDPVPQLIRPYLNTWANKDTFRDRPIENQGDEGKLPSQRYSKVTSPTAVGVIKAIAPVADAINLSPKKLEYMVGGYLGTAGLYALGLSDFAIRALDKEAPPRPETRLDQLPLIGSFYRQEPAFATVYETDLYKMRAEVEQVYKSVKALKKDDKDAEADALEAKNTALLEARKTLERGGKALSRLNKERDALYADKDLTPKQKRAALEDLLRQRAEVSKETMKSDEVVNAQ